MEKSKQLWQRGVELLRKREKEECAGSAQALANKYPKGNRTIPKKKNLKVTLF